MLQPMRPEILFPLFAEATTLKGVGPRLALGILAVHTPDALRRAVGSQDETALQRVSGIGKKGAQRLILELGTKLGPEVGAGPAAPRR